MSNSRVPQWFGPKFSELHPLLQQVHLHGAELTGVVDIHIPNNGIAGAIGRRLAKKLGLPTTAGQHRLRVSISHCAGAMHWDRCFDDRNNMRSIFRPIGTWSDGYFLEDTGPLKMRLTVDIKDGGWYWRCLEIRLFGVRLPLWLFPNSKAFKTIEDGRYRFYVGFAIPLIGVCLAYGGLLSQVETKTEC
jgi:Domain of unknown function (DUF4166)